MWDENAEDIKAGADPMTSSSAKIWGYEENWGSFAQFARVDHYQVHEKPKQLTWEAAAAYMLVGATAYRQLMGWPPHIVNEGDPVLIWGGSGGLALREHRAVHGVQPDDHRRRSRSGTVEGLPAVRGRRRAPAHARERAPAWKHGDPHQRNRERPHQPRLVALEGSQADECDEGAHAPPS
jgi:hypothetical protein